MARKRQGRAGIFAGAARTRHSRPLPVDPPAALAALGAAVYDWDLAGDVLTWGPNATEVLGVAVDRLPRTGRALAQMIEPGSGAADRVSALAGGGSVRTFDVRYPLRLGPDHVVMVQEAGRWQPDAHGLPATVHGLLKAERTDRDQLPPAVRARSALLLRLNDDIADALRFSHTVTLVLGSVDGDADPDAMDGIARRIRPMMRRRDLFTALGPDRFALVLASCLAWDAPGAMKRLMELAAPLRLRLGAACAPDHAFEATDLMRLAEAALAQAAEGSGTAVLHEARRGLVPSGSGPVAEPLDTVRALNERRLTLALQPVADALSREPTLAQAFACMTGPNGRTALLGSAPALDGANLSLLIDGRMLELVADHLDRQAEARVALPVSPETLVDSEWLPMLAVHLGARPGIESRLLIDVPESALRNPGATRGRLDAMKALGVGILLSGFGTGYASPGHLRNLPVDLLRIDGIFIQALDRSTDDRLFVRRLIDTAQHLGIATVAEWVDGEATARRLAEWGVDYLQGRLTGDVAPVPLPGLLPHRAKRA